MGLEPCSDCGTQVSTAAAACPKCGRPQLIVTARAAQGSAGNVVAAALSLFIPGAGQLTQGRAGVGILWFLVALAVWVMTLGLLGWVVNLLACIEAATWNPQRAELRRASR